VKRSANKKQDSRKTRRRRAAGQAGATAPEGGSRPDPEVSASPKRRAFTAEYKRQVVAEADEAAKSGDAGAVGALLRREGLYSSHLSHWRRERDAGELAGLAPKKRGRKGKRKGKEEKELERLRREKAELQERLEKAETVIDVQKKVSRLLGVKLESSSDPEES
jgi:transposase-like protein